MIVAGILHFLFPVVSKIPDFEDDLEWRISELSESENNEEEKMKESIVYMGSHADLVIWQWRRKSKWGSGLLVIFGVVTLIAASKLNQNQPELDNA